MDYVTDEIKKQISDKVSDALQDAIKTRTYLTPNNFIGKRVDVRNEIINGYTEKYIDIVNKSIQEKVEDIIEDTVNHYLNTINKNTFSETDLSDIIHMRKPIDPICVRENNMYISPTCLQEKFSKGDGIYCNRLCFSINEKECADCHIVKRKDLSGQLYTDIMIVDDEVFRTEKDVKNQITKFITRPITENERDIIKEYVSQYIQAYNRIIDSFKKSDNLTNALKDMRIEYEGIKNSKKGWSYGYPYKFAEAIFTIVGNLEKDNHYLSEGWLKGTDLIPDTDMQLPDSTANMVCFMDIDNKVKEIEGNILYRKTIANRENEDNYLER